VVDVELASQSRREALFGQSDDFEHQQALAPPHFQPQTRLDQGVRAQALALQFDVSAVAGEGRLAARFEDSRRA